MNEPKRLLGFRNFKIEFVESAETPYARRSPPSLAWRLRRKLPYAAIDELLPAIYEMVNAEEMLTGGLIVVSDAGMTRIVHSASADEVQGAAINPC